jgi:hypothetical protein
MISFDTISEMLTLNKCSNFRITDVQGAMLFESLNETPEAAQSALDEAKKMLSGYPRINVSIATKGQAAQGWKNAFQYKNVFFSAPAQQQPVQQGLGFLGGAGMPGIMEYFQLKMDYALLQMKMEAKANKKEKGLPEIPASYLPILQAMGLNLAPASGLAGGEQPRHALTQEMTAEEKTAVEGKIEEVEKLVVSILEKADIEKVIKVLKAVDKNPSLLDKVLPFL